MSDLKLHNPSSKELQDQDLNRAEQYWRQLLSGYTAPTVLGVDQAPPTRVGHQESSYDSEEVTLSEAATSALSRWARQQQLTVNTVVQGALAVLLSRYSGSEDVVFGMTVSGHTTGLPGIESMVGLFINTLPVRVHVSPIHSLVPWLTELQGQQVTQREYEHTPLYEIQKWSGVPPGEPLFNTLLVFENIPLENGGDLMAGTTGLNVQRVTGSREGETNYPLTVVVVLGRTLQVRLTYDTEHYTAEAIIRMVGHFQQVLTGTIGGREQTLLGAIPLLTEAEHQQMLVDWNDTSNSYPRDRCVHQLFEQQVEQIPGAVAVVYGDEQLTYRQLNTRANQLAHYLKKLGIGPEVLVGICLERSLEMVIAVLGILKAGGAYVPLDPEYPQERLGFMLADTGSPVLLTHSRLVEELPRHEAKVICIDSDWDAIARHSGETPVSATSVENLAYVIYTSGSTGKPKGVAISHGGLLNLVFWHRNVFEVTASDRATQLAGTAFDASVWEVWPYLTAGARLHVVSAEKLVSPEQLRDWLVSEEITLTFLPTPLAEQVLKLDWPQQTPLRTLLTGGDKLHRSPPESIPFKVVNNYGPTENTVVTTSGVVLPNNDADIQPSIGCPISNTEVYVFDERLRPVPVGVPGELCIGGESLARGYLNRPNLTAENFIPNPYSDIPGARLYKSGDLVRYLQDGSIEFLGRIDHQVKIRGFRIELGEVESVLGRHPAVREAVVVAREDVPGEKRLVAYVVASHEPTPTFSELRSFLKEKLPDYMIPSAFVFLDLLPLTSNGKVDRRALPIPDWYQRDVDLEFVPPTTPIEEILAGIYTEVLGIERVGINDSFYQLGGHSLKATQIVSRIRDLLNVELPLKGVFENPVVSDLAMLLQEKIRGPHKAQTTSINRAPRNEALPLSFSQERIWFIEQLDKENRAYYFQTIYEIKGGLNVKALEKSLSEVVRRHEILRTTFPIVDGRPIQLSHETMPVMLPVVDLQGLDDNARETRLHQLINKEFSRQFDVALLPLIRWMLFKVNGKRHVMIHIEHHLIHDGWSFNVFLGELFEIYHAFSEGKTSPLSDPTIQFADFAYWQRQWMEGKEAEKQLAYWQKQLAGSPPVLELPYDYPRPVKPRFKGAALRSELPEDICRRLKEFSQNESVTLFMTTLAGFVALLYRYSGQDDICVGTGMANRRWRETENLLGMIINNVVLRTDVSSNPSIRELIRQVRTVILDAAENQDLPFDTVVRVLQPERSLGHNPLYQVMFAFHDAPMPNIELPGLEGNLELGLNNGSAKFDMSVTLIPHSAQRFGQPQEAMPDKFTIVWEYDTDLFERATIARMMHHYQMILEGIAANPEQRVSELSLLTNAERQQLLVEWNDTSTDYPRTQCIHQLFEVQAERNPEAIAVTFDKDQLTYSELNTRANQLAHYLKKLGVGPEVLVAICLERCLEMVVALMGIHKAGGAYVPLDPAYPKERLNFILNDTQAEVLLTKKPMIDRLPNHKTRVVCLDSDWDLISKKKGVNPKNNTLPGNLTYMIYTSGSTGKPKGVMVEHRSIINLAEALYGSIYDSDRQGSLIASLNSPLSFDASVQQLVLLLYGHTIDIIPEESRIDIMALRKHLSLHRVDVLDCVPSQLKLLVDSGFLDATEGTPSIILPGGEAIDQVTWKMLKETPEIEFYNMYGPTECTVDAAIARVKTAGGQPTIGRPVSNTQFYVLDDQLQLVPIGIPGELCIGGDGLARGYFNRPELTAEKFIPNPFSEDPAARLYKTGDLARYLPDGSLEFLGRIDHQVKIRGFRIELGEVESVLGRHPTVEEAVVIAREDVPGDKRLVAYVVSSNVPPPTFSEMRSFLKKKLPDYMIPSAFVYLDSLPITPHGKVDRRALPAPEQSRSELEAVYVAPQSEVERIIAEVWQQVLRIEQVGMHDNFFDLGGHSLLLIQIHNKFQEHFKKEIPIADIFRYPTIKALADHLAQEENDRVPIQQTSDSIEKLAAGKNRMKQLYKRRQQNKEKR